MKSPIDSAVSGSGKIVFESTGIFDLDPAVVDPDLRAAVLQYIDVRKTGADAALSAYQSNPTAGFEVSPERLTEILDRGKDVHGIRTERGLSNVISLAGRNFKDLANEEAVRTSRAAVDREVGRLVQTLFTRRRSLAIIESGHFWYPPGAYMGWHTNNEAPGWRIYVNYADDEGRSFFRYQDPDTREIVTLKDRHWNVRIFRINPAKPLWHAVYSDTHRYSFGYMVYSRSYPARVFRSLKRLITP